MTATTNDAPGHHTEDVESNQAVQHIKLSKSLGDRTDDATLTRPTLVAAEVYEIIRGRLAAHVITKDIDGRVRCRSYVNLRSAERAVARAVDRGQAATVVMVRQDVAPLVAKVGDDRG